jgi:hypothetical protein
MPSKEIELYISDESEYITFLRGYAPYVDTELQANFDYISPEADDLETHIKRIFRSSFPVSNGSPFLQFTLQTLGLRVLDHAFEEGEVAEAFKQIELNPKEFYPPRRHVGIDHTEDMTTEQYLDSRIPKIWSVYEDIANNLDDIDQVTESDEMLADDWYEYKFICDLHLELISAGVVLLFRDLVYLKSGRPQARSNKAKYMSSAKRYIIDSAKTGSDELDLVCRGIRATFKYCLDDATPKDPDQFCRVFAGQYRKVVKAWEQRNQAYGQFATDDFAGLTQGTPHLDSSISGEDWSIINS